MICSPSSRIFFRSEQRDPGCEDSTRERETHECHDDGENRTTPGGLLEHSLKHLAVEFFVFFTVGRLALVVSLLYLGQGRRLRYL